MGLAITPAELLFSCAVDCHSWLSMVKEQLQRFIMLEMHAHTPRRSLWLWVQQIARYNGPAQLLSSGRPPSPRKVAASGKWFAAASKSKSGFAMDSFDSEFQAIH